MLREYWIYSVVFFNFIYNISLVYTFNIHYGEYILPYTNFE